MDRLITFFVVLMALILISETATILSLDTQKNIQTILINK